MNYLLWQHTAKSHISSVLKFLFCIYHWLRSFNILISNSAQSLTQRRRLLIIRRIFALIIPLTIIAFSLGIPATFQSESSVEIKLPSEFLPPKPTSVNQIHNAPRKYHTEFHIFDLVSLLITF